MRTTTSLGFSARSRSGARPHRSIVPGRKFSISTSLTRTRSTSSSCPGGWRRSSVTKRLPRLCTAHHRELPLISPAPQLRNGSSLPGASTLMTSAPKSASRRPANGHRHEAKPRRQHPHAGACHVRGRGDDIDPWPQAGEGEGQLSHVDVHAAGVFGPGRGQRRGMPRDQCDPRSMTPAGDAPSRVHGERRTLYAARYAVRRYRKLDRNRTEQRCA
jgi:hypothetical protein